MIVFMATIILRILFYDKNSCVDENFLSPKSPTESIFYDNLLMNNLFLIEIELIDSLIIRIYSQLNPVVILRGQNICM